VVDDLESIASCSVSPVMWIWVMERFCLSGCNL